jgi:putative component of membrane protein insertase Oxa1/YidC/SpoIIIJ protein YidD
MRNTCPAHPPEFHYPTNILRRLQIVKLYNVQFSPVSCHFIPIGSAYHFQHCSQTPVIYPSLIVRDTMVRKFADNSRNR